MVLNACFMQPTYEDFVKIQTGTFAFGEVEIMRKKVESLYAIDRFEIITNPILISDRQSVTSPDVGNYAGWRHVNLDDWARTCGYSFFSDCDAVRIN